MNAVIADEQRNTQTRLVAHYPRRTHEIVGRGVQNRAHMAVHNEIRELATARVELHHLPHLLLESHAAEQVGDARGNRQGRIQIWHICFT